MRENLKSIIYLFLLSIIVVLFFGCSEEEDIVDLPKIYEVNLRVNVNGTLAQGAQLVYNDENGNRITKTLEPGFWRESFSASRGYPVFISVQCRIESGGSASVSARVTKESGTVFTDSENLSSSVAFDFNYTIEYNI